MENREQWGTRLGFILTAVGSAIGLGNIWRFPYQAYSNGGGTFLIPYFFAMLTAGIPILIMEFGLGHKYHSGAPGVFKKLSDRASGLNRFEWIGWWQVMIAVVITSYYVVVVAWSLAYGGLAVFGSWGEDPAGYFFKDFLQVTDSPFNFGGINWYILLTVAIVWFITWIILYSGVKKGIEAANKIFMPTLIVLVLILTARCVMLNGAGNGLNWLFKPDFSKLWDVSVWTAAYGQIFYSMSIGFAIMITYSSYLPKKSDIVNNGFMTGLLNCGFSVVSGILIFAILGHMAKVEGVGVDQVVASGIGLAFVTIPKAINYLPAPYILGPLFFISLTIAGVSSIISINEAIVASFSEKFNLNRKKVATVLCLVMMLVSVIYTTGSGIFILDIVDHFVNNFGILFAGLVEVILVAWFFNSDFLKDHINPFSDFKVGRFWKICLCLLTPLVLGSMAISNFANELGIGFGSILNRVNSLSVLKDAGIKVSADQIVMTYEGYSLDAIFTFGWLVIVAIIPISFALQYHKATNRAFQTSIKEN